MSKREYLFKIFDDFMNNFYSRDNISKIIEYNLGVIDNE